MSNLKEYIFSNLQTYSKSEEDRVLFKFRESAKKNYTTVETNLNLYDDEDKGTITINDLKDCLLSIEIYEEKD
jgi:septum formation topological specificity factor MinE